MPSIVSSSQALTAQQIAIAQKEEADAIADYYGHIAQTYDYIGNLNYFIESYNRVQHDEHMLRSEPHSAREGIMPDMRYPEPFFPIEDGESPLAAAHSEIERCMALIDIYEANIADEKDHLQKLFNQDVLISRIQRGS